MTKIRVLFILPLLFSALLFSAEVRAETKQEQAPPLTLLNPPAAAPAQQAGQVPGAGVEDTGELRDIIGPIAPEPKMDLLLPLILGAAVLLLAIMVFMIIRQKRKKVVATLPPHELAFANLQECKGLLTEGRERACAARLSEILRQYLESGFRINSTRKTTVEIFQTLSTVSGSSVRELKKYENKLHECLEMGDLAKFAHFSPTLENLRQTEAAVRSFIKRNSNVLEGEKK